MGDFCHDGGAKPGAYSQTQERDPPEEPATKDETQELTSRPQGGVRRIAPRL